MDIVSLTSNALRYHKSASNLSVVSEYSNVANAKSDLSILPKSKSLIKFWRSSGVGLKEDSCLEIWRVSKKNENGK